MTGYTAVEKFLCILKMDFILVTAPKIVSCIYLFTHLIFFLQSNIKIFIYSLSFYVSVYPSVV